MLTQLVQMKHLTALDSLNTHTVGAFHIMLNTMCLVPLLREPWLRHNFLMRTRTASSLEEWFPTKFLHPIFFFLNRLHAVFA